MSIEKDIGYLIRASEDNSKDISKFYDLLEGHMGREDKERRSMNIKLTIIFGISLVSASNGSGITDTILGGIKTFLPFVL